MCPVAVIPFKPVNPKTRLAPLLDQEEREAFARAMLDDVIGAVRSTGLSPVILSTEQFETEEVVVTIEGGLNDSLNDYLQSCVTSALIIMADIPLADEEAVKRMIGTEKDIAIVPGRGGGTNAIFIRDPARFRVDYYGGSFRKHKNIAEEAGLSFELIDSFRLHTDVDEREDLVEVLIHGTGKSRAFLEAKGFVLNPENGRVIAERKK